MMSRRVSRSDCGIRCPTSRLLDAAASGQLATREQVARQAERMVTDLRARAKLRDFLLQWLKVDQAAEIVKDPKRFPAFNEAIVSDLRTSLDLFLDDVIRGDSADFRELLCADYVYLNGRLAASTAPISLPDARFRRFASSRGERAGVLSHPYLMANFAYTGDELTDPSRRLSRPERAGPGPPAAARSRRTPGRRSAPRSDNARARDTADQARILPVVPRDDQPARIYAGAFRCARSIPKRKRKGQPIDAAGYYETRAGETGEI